MTFSTESFKEFIESIPLINIPLEWDGGEGSADMMDKEIQTAAHTITASFNVYEAGVVFIGDGENPAEFNSNGICVSDISYEIIHKEQDEEFFLTASQELEFKMKITSQIFTT